MTKGLDSCLFVFTEEKWASVVASIGHMSLTNKDARSFSRFLIGGAGECEVDKQGRILIPGNLRTYAHLEKDVVLVGVGTRVEIWNREAWESASDYEGIEELAEGLEELRFLTMGFEHKSVLLEETIAYLNIRPDGIYADGTLGGGGHASEVLKRLGPSGRYIGIDQDADALAAAGERLKPFGDRVTIVRDNYENMGAVLKKLGISQVDGILLDLGVSSYQLDTPERGFSYKTDTVLDMRMDQRQRITAKDIVNGYSESELYRIIRDYGEDKIRQEYREAYRGGEREKKSIETTGQLVEIIREAVPAKAQMTGGHPAKKTFQGDPDRAQP